MNLEELHVGAGAFVSEAASCSYFLLLSSTGNFSTETTHGQAKVGGDEFTCVVLR